MRNSFHLVQRKIYVLYRWMSKVKHICQIHSSRHLNILVHAHAILAFTPIHMTNHSPPFLNGEGQ